MTPHAGKDTTRATGTYKFQRLREDLRQAVLGGVLRGKLPGERELARRYHVNAKTISKALTDLSSEGLLVRQVGRGTFVADQLDENHALGRRKKFLWVVSADSPASRYQAVFEVARENLQRAGHQIDLDHAIVDDSGRIPGNWLSPQVLRDIDGVVICSSDPAHELIADLHRRRIPVVLANCQAERVKCNGVRPDFARGAFELTEQLIWARHTRIALVIRKDHRLARHDAERGYRAAMTRSGLSPRDMLADEEATLEAAFRSPQKPTALIVYTNEVARTVREAWQSCHLTGEAPLPAIAILRPPGEQDRAGCVQGYSFDAASCADWSVRLLLEAAPGQSPREVVLPGTLSHAAEPPRGTSTERAPAPSIVTI